jgi:agmatinase
MNFNPGDVGVKGSLFGYPYNENESDLIILPVPWDVTVSYRDGTSNGPVAIKEASPQLDFEIPGIRRPWKYKVFMRNPSLETFELSNNYRNKAKKIIDQLENGQSVDENTVEEINTACEQLIASTQKEASDILNTGKLCATLGGDHSTPLGLIRALGEIYNYGILQIDAHMDLRNAYEGFTYSHASIMYNALKATGVSGLVQVGIRDFAEEEVKFIESASKKVSVFYDSDISKRLFNGNTWADVVSEIISKLPEHVYVSFDIDGLDPSLCPNTGTPVPGGLSFNQVDYLLDSLVRSGKKIIGFDVSEVNPSMENDWDANVGARILFRLCTYMGLSQKKIEYIQ